MDVARRIQEGLKLQQKGKLLEAAEIYRAVLTAEPENVDALNLLSAVFQVLGNQELAINLAREAIRIDPDFFAPHVNLGNALQASGAHEAAAEAFGRALELRPLEAAAAVNLSSALCALHRYIEAEEAARRALDIAPEIAEAHNNLGNALAGRGRNEDALEAYNRAIRLRKGFVQARVNRARVRLALGERDEARVELDAILAETPDNALANALSGDLLMTEDDWEGAIAAYLKSLERDPANLDARANLGAGLHALGALDEAEHVFRDALRLSPEAPDLHWNLALLLLQKGVYREGWREYEWRWRLPAFTEPARDFGKPVWNGADPFGKTLLVHAEQGLGDSIQFARYVPLLVQRGANVIVECRAPLVRVFETLEGVASVHARDTDLPPFDMHVPMMSLPRLFGTTLGRVPDKVPYLGVPDGAVADSRIAESRGLKIGFAWAGSPTQRNDANRSCRPEEFETLFDLEGVSFFSLQKGPGEADFERMAPRANVHALGPEFPEMAAAMRELDLVITVDTAVGHLAGALGRPAWVIMAWPPSYLWPVGRDDSPWYPSMRLFRQKDRRDWPGVFARIRDALIALRDGP